MKKRENKGLIVIIFTLLNMVLSILNVYFSIFRSKVEIVNVLLFIFLIVSVKFTLKTAKNI